MEVETDSEVTDSKAKQRKAPVEEDPGSRHSASKKPAPTSFKDIYEEMGNVLGESVERSDEESDKESDKESGKESDWEKVNSGVPQLYVPGLLETVMQKIQCRPSTPKVSE